MAIRQILTDEDPILRKKSRVVTDFNERLWTLIDDMIETMDKANGVGLAAVQIGVLRRVIVINPRDEEERKAIELVNPVIIDKEGKQVNKEACLSIPSTQGMVERPTKIKIKAKDRFGKDFTIDGEDYLAIIMCHETDHLDGVLYTDLATELFDIYEDDDMEDVM